MRLDDDAYLDASESPSHSIGEIKLDIFRTTIPKKIQEKKPKKRRQDNSTVSPEPPFLQKVHERSKKRIAHQVKFLASLILYNA